ncbi:Flp family type IVb pilin [Nioella sp.]|uniref:Flp family type IVb pilin n=1 Tax=Nioella sp. TaxID=1912091 RepID=UPI003B51E602
MTCVAQFWNEENGSATVEWVVMTAASVAMGLAVMSYVSEGVENLSNDVRSALSGFEIMTSFDQWDDFRAQQAAEAAAAASEDAESQ